LHSYLKCPDPVTGSYIITDGSQSRRR
jgi:hypothetical protein